MPVHERMVNERKDIVDKAHYPEPVSLTGVILTFWMRKLGAADYKVSAAACDPPTDVSDQYGMPAGRVWEHRFTPSGTAFDAEGRYDYQFRQDYGSNRYQYIPGEGVWGRIVVTGPAVA
jgi:hypothetical protein